MNTHSLPPDWNQDKFLPTTRHRLSACDCLSVSIRSPGELTLSQIRRVQLSSHSGASVHLQLFVVMINQIAML